MKRLTLIALALSTSLAAHAQTNRAATIQNIKQAQAALYPTKAPSPWFQTGVVTEKDNISDQYITQREYIIPHSVLKLGNGSIGRVYGVKVRDTFDPPVADIQAVVSDAVIDCDRMTWGEYSSVAFKADGEPVSFSTSEVSHGQVWLPKEMGSPAAAPYKTLAYICQGN